MKVGCNNILKIIFQRANFTYHIKTNYKVHLKKKLDKRFTEKIICLFLISLFATRCQGIVIVELYASCKV